MNLNHDVTVFMIIMVWGGISSDNETLDIDYTTRIDDIKKLIGDFVYGQELTTPSKYNVYNV